jgi:hypothetical protein
MGWMTLASGSLLQVDSNRLLYQYQILSTCSFVGELMHAQPRLPPPLLHYSSLISRNVFPVESIGSHISPIFTQVGYYFPGMSIRCHLCTTSTPQSLGLPANWVVIRFLVSFCHISISKLRQDIMKLTI